MARSAAATKLEKYRSMRDFSRTAEPSGESHAAHAGHRYVIQQHAARRMHYDFRLELDGVLLSWSVPKGPSLSPTARRLAVRTEDHPVDYADFEGVIPAGEYGGGTVVVWDRGSWQPEGDARAAIAKGKLTFALHGEKLRGRWHLVKTRSEGKAENWLLFKGRDDAANDQLDVVASQPASVLSGRTLDEIAAAPERIWHSNRAAAPTIAEKRAARIAAAAPPKPALAVRRPRRKHAAQAAGAATSISLVEQLPLGFELTNLNKVLYPDDGITKGDLIAYLAVVSDWALPQLADRPLMLARCPDGIATHAAKRARTCFYQKHLLPGSPAAIDTVADIDSDGEPIRHMRVHDMAGIVALAQLGTLEIHTWGTRADQIDQPDLMVFDLDPDPSVGWDRVAQAAFELRRRLHDGGLESFVKTTGGKGLHVVAPITRGIGWDDFKAFTKAVVEAMQHDAPDRYTTNMAKARRSGRIFLDYLRNGRGATFVAPYSPRARPGAPVAVPISWEELAHGVDPTAFTIETVPRRLAALPGDPWAALGELRQSITPHAWRACGGKPQ
jgi:bifunctional non-homologous end joining protein LigD